MAYIRGNQQESIENPGAITGLWTADLSTRQQQPVRLGRDMFLNVCWGTNGWLVINKGDQIWKIKPNGDSLTQLTFGVTHYNPQWSPDGQRLVCTANQYLVLMDKDGKRLAAPGLETRAGYARGWSPDGNLLLLDCTSNDGQQPGLGIYDFRTGKTQFVVALRGTAASPAVSNGCFGASWLPDSQSFVWSSIAGIFRTNASNGSTVRLHSGCESRIYLNPSVAADGRQLIVQRIDKKGVEGGTKIYAEGNLWTMNLDGSNERKVEF